MGDLAPLSDDKAAPSVVWLLNLLLSVWMLSEPRYSDPDESPDPERSSPSGTAPGSVSPPVAHLAAPRVFRPNACDSRGSERAWPSVMSDEEAAMGLARPIEAGVCAVTLSAGLGPTSLPGESDGVMPARGCGCCVCGLLVPPAEPRARFVSGASLSVCHSLRCCCHSRSEVLLLGESRA